MTATGVSPASGTVFIIILIGRRQVMFAFACIIGSRHDYALGKE